MNRIHEIMLLNGILSKEMPEYQRQAKKFPHDEISQRKLLRSLMNIRPPMPLQDEFLQIQNRLLSSELHEKGVVDGASLPPTSTDKRLVVWQGDITRLRVDGIVNAANSGMLGCFIPCHRCIDNAIHSAAGLQLREECNRMMLAQEHEEPTGSAKITKGYNLPAKNILHTVGPIIQSAVTTQDCKDLASCYRSCLELAAQHNLSSLAFCCISTGEFHFPNRLAAEIAVKTVQDFIKEDSSIERVIFNVFKELDAEIYHELLG